MEWESQDRQHSIVFRAQLEFRHNPNPTLYQPSNFEMAFLSFFLVNSYSSLKSQLKLHLVCELSPTPPGQGSIAPSGLLSSHP